MAEQSHREEYHRRCDEHRSQIEEFLSRRAAYEPDDYDGCQNWNQRSEGKLEWLSSIGAHVPALQLDRRETAREIDEQGEQNDDHSERRECCRESKQRADHAVKHNRNVRRAEALVHTSEEGREKRIASERIRHSRRGEHVTRHVTQCGDRGSENNQQLASST